MTKELYDTIQLGIAAATIATPISIWFYGRMKYGSGSTKESIEEKKQETMAEIRKAEEDAKIEVSRNQNYAVIAAADLKYNLELTEKRRQMLADPAYQSYLNQRQKLAGELLQRKGFLGRLVYANQEKLEATLDSILGPNPIDMMRRYYL